VHSSREGGCSTWSTADWREAKCVLLWSRVPKPQQQVYIDQTEVAGLLDVGM
jgi:hypothetical protein